MKIDYVEFQKVQGWKGRQVPIQVPESVAEAVSSGQFANEQVILQAAVRARLYYRAMDEARKLLKKTPTTSVPDVSKLIDGVTYGAQRRSAKAGTGKSRASRKNAALNTITSVAKVEGNTVSFTLTDDLKRQLAAAGANIPGLDLSAFKPVETPSGNGETTPAATPAAPAAPATPAAPTRGGGKAGTRK